MLTAAQIAEYHEKGYVVPGYRLGADTLAAIRRDHDRLLVEHPEFRDNCPALLSHDMAFLNYARDGEILDMAEQLIGPDIALWNMSFFAKPPPGRAPAREGTPDHVQSHDSAARRRDGKPPARWPCAAPARGGLAPLHRHLCARRDLVQRRADPDRGLGGGTPPDHPHHALCRTRSHTCNHDAPFAGRAAAGQPQ